MVPSLRAADLYTLAAVPWQVVVETWQVVALAARKASGRPAERVVPGELTVARPVLEEGAQAHRSS